MIVSAGFILNGFIMGKFDKNNAVALAEGLGMGLLLGLIFNNLRLGIVIGVCLGLSIAAKRRRNRKDN